MQMLLKAIEEVQAKYGLKDSELADSLGVDRSLICRMKQGTQEPGADFLALLTTKYPELDFIVMHYLKERGLEKSATNNQQKR
jgi:predicted transcriptional regulator